MTKLTRTRCGVLLIVALFFLGWGNVVWRAVHFEDGAICEVSHGSFP